MALIILILISVYIYSFRRDFVKIYNYYLSFYIKWYNRRYEPKVKEPLPPNPALDTLEQQARRHEEAEWTRNFSKHHCPMCNGIIIITPTEVKKISCTCKNVGTGGM